MVFENPCLDADLTPTILQTDYNCEASTANVAVDGAEGFTYALFDFSADGIISTQEGGFVFNALPAGDYLLIVNGAWDCTNEIAFTVTPPAELDANANGLRAIAKKQQVAMIRWRATMTLRLPFLTQRSAPTSKPS